MADASKFREATGWEPEIDFQESVERVCRPYLEDAPETNEAGRDRDRKRNSFELLRGFRLTDGYGMREISDFFSSLRPDSVSSPFVFPFMTAPGATV